MALPILFFISVLPVFVIAVIIYAIDKEKESVGTMFKYYGLGLLSAVIAVIVELFVQIDSGTSLFLTFINTFFCIALVEESAKMFCLKIGLSGERSYNNFYDSIIFATAVSLGFAGIENVLYVLSSSFTSLQLGIGTGIMRALLAVPGHVIFAVYMGFFLDRATGAQMQRKSRAGWDALAIIVPTALHGIYDFFCFTMGTIIDDPIYFLLFVLFIVFMYISGITLIVIGARKSHLPFGPSNTLMNGYNNLGVRQGPTINYQNVDYSKGYKVCKTCGNTIASDFCPYCGTNNQEINPNYNPFTNQSGKICPYCGTVSQGNFCTKCGTPLNN